jgi:hypothetical protein
MENNDPTSAWCGACVASHLPEACAIGIDNNAGALLVRRGRPGFSFYRSVIPSDFNEAYSITPAQVSAMLLGAVTGWRSPFINAGLFDSTGLLFAQPREVSHCAYWCAARGLSGQISDDGRLPPKLSAASRDSIRENRQAFIASVRWRSFYCAEVRAAEQAFA